MTTTTTTKQQLLKEYFAAFEYQGQFTLEQFASYFPPEYQQHGRVKTLYKEYTQWRNSVKASLNRNIEQECDENDPQKMTPVLPLTAISTTKDMERQPLAESVRTLNKAKQQLLKQQQQLNQQCEHYLQEMTAMGDAIDTMTVDTVDLNVLPLESLQQQWTQSNHIA